MHRLLDANYGKPCSRPQLDLNEKEKKEGADLGDKGIDPATKELRHGACCVCVSKSRSQWSAKLELTSHLGCGQCRKSCRMQYNFRCRFEVAKPENGDSLRGRSAKPQFPGQLSL